jgi:hypothetical protein
MIDITQCAACGRTIPATEQGCAYCESERPSDLDSDYVPMARRWLLALFVLLCGFAIWSGALTAWHVVSARAWSLSPWPAGRIALGLLAGWGVATRRRHAVRFASALLASELALGIAVQTELLAREAWRTTWIAPFWAVFFLLFFARSDVRAHFSPQLRDRLAVLALLREVGTKEPK